MEHPLSMEPNTCFVSYRDFTTSLCVYQEATNSSFCIKSCVDVAVHNCKFKTNIRHDIVYSEVMLCCKFNVPKDERETQDEAYCPAHIFLQYDTDLDCLVIKNKCLPHIHLKNSEPPVTVLSLDFEVLSAKIGDQKQALSLVKQNVQENLQQYNPSLCKSQNNVLLEMHNIDNGNTRPMFAIPKNLTSKVFVDNSRLELFIKEYKKKEGKEIKSFVSFGKNNEMEMLSFQTTNLSDWFLKFPESLLLHRFESKYGYILYAFQVKTNEHIGKLIYFCFVIEDQAGHISLMLESFKTINSEWPKVKVIYIDVSFGQTDILKEAFPSVQVLLSVYHTAQTIKKKIQGSHEFKYWVNKWITEAIHNTAPEKLKLLARRIEHRLDQDLHAKLCNEWFSNDILWNMHVKDGVKSCKTYMESVALIDETISGYLARQSLLESLIKKLITFAESFNKGVEKQEKKATGKRQATEGGASQDKENKENFTFAVPFSKPFKSQPKNTTKKPRTILPKPPASSSVSKVSNQFMGNDYDGILIDPIKSDKRLVWFSKTILPSLKEFCNDIGIHLCSKEWKEISKSTYVMYEEPSFTVVSVLEDVNTVSLNDYTCTCNFNKEYNVPCRHILSMLYADKKPVEEKMFGPRWRKKYLEPISDSKIYSTITVFNDCAGSKAAITVRAEKIKTLVNKFYNFLMQCDGQELQVKMSMLQKVVDMWLRDSSSDKLEVAEGQATELS